MIYRITRKIHGSQGFSLLASLLYMAMPIAVSEALTTQTDHFAALWLLYFVYLLLDFTGPQKIVFDGSTVRKVCTMGLCVSLGYLAKPSVCIAMALFVLWLLLHCIVRKDSLACLFRLLACVIPAILLPLIPETLRNRQTLPSLLIRCRAPPTHRDVTPTVCDSEFFEKLYFQSAQPLSARQFQPDSAAGAQSRVPVACESERCFHS